MTRFSILLSFILVIQVSSFGQEKVHPNDGRNVVFFEDKSRTDTNNQAAYNPKVTIIPHLEIPKTTPKDHIVIHTGYSLLYNEEYEQANWVAYELTKEETKKQFKRGNKFMVDPLITTGSADNADYARSGYDRGHMAPAADMSWSEITMKESFYYSNMSPQVPAFNRGIWKSLEELVRTWAIENEAIYVVTGPVLTKGLPTIGHDKVAVPAYYYKVILDYTEPGIKGIGFILPNEGSGEPLQNFAVSIDSVESVTGIDFFPLLPDEQEKHIERTLSVNDWSWKSTSTAKYKEEAPENTDEPAIAEPAGTNTEDQIFTGPRGGKYRISKSGRKVYIKGE